MTGFIPLPFSRLSYGKPSSRLANQVTGELTSPFPTAGSALWGHVSITTLLYIGTMDVTDPSFYHQDLQFLKSVLYRKKYIGFQPE